MKILEIIEKDRSRYEQFMNSHDVDIHQSYSWGELQEKIPGRGKFWAFAVTENGKSDGKWLGTVMVVRYNLPFGLCWLSVVRGPILAAGVKPEEVWVPLFGAIEALAKREKAVFVRVELPEGSELELNGKGWRKAHAHYQPEWTLKVDLKEDEEKILAQMKQKGRYNIKVARKKGVEVRMTHRGSDVFAFYEVLEKTGGRDEFSIHPESYYQQFVTSGHEGGWGELFVAELDGKVIGGLFATFYGKTAIYYYGASDHEHRATMAPYLTQWTAMQEAKARGCEEYDFLGIAPPNEPNHSWAGITQFKTKFGGETVQYKPAVEFVFRPFWYALMKLRKKLKR